MDKDSDNGAGKKGAREVNRAARIAAKIIRGLNKINLDDKNDSAKDGG